jgi:CRP-like cAMP-binding protein
VLLPLWDKSMASLRKSDLQNQLLLLLPDEEFATVAQHLEPVEIPQRFLLAEAGAKIRHAYFPDAGIGSIIAQTPLGQSAEAGLFGRDGWAPASVSNGSDISLYEIPMQVGGKGHRMQRDAFLRLLESMPAFRSLMTQYIQVLSAQTAYTALSNAAHQINQRLARWLLMCHDRVENDDIALTHDFLALMLAVRRPSVTTALHSLEDEKLVRSERGRITVEDRKALEAFASDSYGVPEKEYHRVFGVRIRRS